VVGVLRRDKVEILPNEPADERSALKHKQLITLPPFPGTCSAFANPHHHSPKPTSANIQLKIRYLLIQYNIARPDPPRIARLNSPRTFLGLLKMKWSFDCPWKY
jgi:hypothetical protein